jgi:hypothetical protein
MESEGRGLVERFDDRTVYGAWLGPGRGPQGLICMIRVQSLERRGIREILGSVCLDGRSGR